MNPGRVVRPARMDEDLRVFVGMPTHARRARCWRSPTTAALHPRHPPLPRRGQVRHRERRRDVPQLPGHRGGEALHPRAGAAAVRDGQRRGDQGRLAVADEVAEALDLCLSCKGCKRDCPVGVDMASYKTEFLAQRYKGRVRPAAHYSMGALPRWLRPGRPAPGRRGRRAERRRPAARWRPWRSGWAASRRSAAIPPIAPAHRSPAAAGRVLRGSARPGLDGVLEADSAPSASRRPRRAAGPACCCGPTPSPTTSTPASPPTPSPCWRRSATPSSCRRATVCCGLTWTSTGQVDAARRVLRRSLRAIEPWLAEGVPVVGLEPSCTAALRSDGPELLPDEPLAAALRRRRAHVRRGARRARRRAARRACRRGPAQQALVQVHCHQHAELGTEADRGGAWPRSGVDAEVLDSGCCGLAGNFGFEKGHYEVSMACAERVLLPAVRAADAGRRGAGRRLQLPHPAAPGRHPGAGAPGPARGPGCCARDDAAGAGRPGSPVAGPHDPGAGAGRDGRCRLGGAAGRRPASDRARGEPDPAHDQRVRAGALQARVRRGRARRSRSAVRRAVRGGARGTGRGALDGGGGARVAAGGPVPRRGVREDHWSLGPSRRATSTAPPASWRSWCCRSG